MVMILSHDEYTKGTHRTPTTEASVVLVKDDVGYLKVKDRLERCGLKADRYSLEGLVSNVEKHMRTLYYVDAQQVKETDDTNE